LERALVTGGAGFIGSNIVEALLKKGVKVYALDDFRLGEYGYLNDLSRKYGDLLTIVKGDVRDAKLIDELVSKVDVVFHQAAVSSTTMFYEDPREGIEVNLNGFLNILQSARKHNIKRIVYASTSSIYVSVEPPHREDAIVTPKTFYEYTFWMREHAARIYYDFYGVESIGLRYFSIYGPREQHKKKYANIVTQFLWGMLESKPPVIFGDGSQTRDFTFVHDVVRANLLAAEIEDVGADVFNVGTGRNITFNKVVEVLNEKLGTNIEPIYKENPIKNYVYHTKADTTKAEKILGFKAEISFEEGVERIIEYYKDPKNRPKM